MFGRFLPRSDIFFDFFEKQASIVVEGTRQLHAMLTGNPEEFPLKARQIHDLEHQADHNGHQCIEILHKTFITPFEREDIYKLIVHLDDIIDFVEAVAERIVLYRLKEIMPESQSLAKILYKAAQEIEFAVQGLRTKKTAEMMRQCFIAVHQLENEGDDVYRYAVGRLFDEEQDIRLLIKWKEVYEYLENGIDCCEDVANIIEGVILERD